MGEKQRDIRKLQGDGEQMQKTDKKRKITHEKGIACGRKANKGQVELTKMITKAGRERKEEKN